MAQHRNLESVSWVSVVILVLCAWFFDMQTPRAGSRSSTPRTSSATVRSYVFIQGAAKQAGDFIA